MSRGRSVVSSFGARLRQLRNAAGLRQAELAERADLASETISRMETGKWPNTTIEVAERLADALGVNITDLFEGSAPPETKQRPDEKRVMALLRSLPDDEVADIRKVIEILVGVRSRRRSRTGNPHGKPTSPK
jgi:transcriptional regulator with XRE-family HTH domain